MKKRVIIIIPMYREFTKTEKISFERCVTVLNRYPICILHPQKLNVNNVIAQYNDMATITETALPDKHFTGIDSYNDLLFSEEFYALYSDYEYMLIYQLDAYVFEDKLEEWCAKGYDYVGAPWIPTLYYYKKIWGGLRQWWYKRKPVDIYHIPHCFKYFAVGNGGFSLRRIETMRQIMHDDKEIIRQCHYNEDWYISQVATRTHNISIPHWREALSFSFEHSLKNCYRLNDHQLPFGCHYWDHERYYKEFWHRFIKK